MTSRRSVLGLAGLVLFALSCSGPERLESRKTASPPQGYHGADAIARVRAPSEPPNTDSFDARPENEFFRAADDPLSTFAIDVDTASYSIVRRKLVYGAAPPAGSVRVEELINYFPYDYPEPRGGTPFSISTETTAAPWAPAHRLLRIGLRAQSPAELPSQANNLVFLIDVSGSMNSPDKLPLLLESMRLLVGELDRDDRVAIAVYAGSSGLVLPPTPGDRRAEIEAALSRLSAGGSTNGAEGIELAYRTAREAFAPGGNNRVILCTDGDFDVGISNRSELAKRVEAHAKKGVVLTVLGFGLGNLKDDTMELLGTRGNGSYAYIDSLAEARKVLVASAGGTLRTVAKDVKIQVEWNPAQVAGYRLIGYENRRLEARDWNDDEKDGGEIGAGHTVNALYEVVPAGLPVGVPAMDPLKYGGAPASGGSGELCTIKIHYKEPDGETSALFEQAVSDRGDDLTAASADLRFASAVAAFGMLLAHSPHAGSASFEMVVELAESGVGADHGGYRRDFLELLRHARRVEVASD